MRPEHESAGYRLNNVIRIRIVGRSIVLRVRKRRHQFGNDTFEIANASKTRWHLLGLETVASAVGGGFQRVSIRLRRDSVKEEKIQSIAFKDDR